MLDFLYPSIQSFPFLFRSEEPVRDARGAKRKIAASRNRTHDLPSRKVRKGAKALGCTSQCLCLQDTSPRRSTTEPSPQVMIISKSCRTIKVGATSDNREGKVLRCLLCLPRPDSLDRLSVLERYLYLPLWYSILLSRTDAISISCLLSSFHRSVFYNPHYKSNMS